MTSPYSNYTYLDKSLRSWEFDVLDRQDFPEKKKKADLKRLEKIWMEDEPLHF
jgi:hypothetical protein